MADARLPFVGAEEPAGIGPAFPNTPDLAVPAPCRTPHRLDRLRRCVDSLNVEIDSLAGWLDRPGVTHGWTDEDRRCVGKLTDLASRLAHHAEGGGTDG